MTTDQWSALLSLLAALVIVVASFRQWVTVGVDGGLELRRWARRMLVAVIGLLAMALLLLGLAVVK